MAEIEIAIFERKVLSRRPKIEEAQRHHIEARDAERNEQRRDISWQFTSHNARRRLELLYPVKEVDSPEHRSQQERDNRSLSRSSPALDVFDTDH